MCLTTAILAFSFFGQRRAIFAACERLSRQQLRAKRSFADAPKHPSLLFSSQLRLDLKTKTLYTPLTPFISDNYVWLFPPPPGI